MHAVVLKALEQSRAEGIHLAAVGLGTPGTVTADGVVTGALPNMPDWEGVPIVQELEHASGLPSIAENDANLMTLAEALVGAGRGFGIVCGVTFGTGIGGGLVIDGEIYRGVAAAGEIGHMTVVLDGRPCLCGGKGCFERYAAAGSLEEGYLSQTGQLVAAKEVLSRWLHGDPVAAVAVARFARFAGMGLGNVLNLLHPECLVLGGGLLQAGTKLFDLLADEVRQASLPVISSTVEIRATSLGMFAGVVGAGLLCLRPAPLAAVGPKSEG